MNEQELKQIEEDLKFVQTSFTAAPHQATRHIPALIAEVRRLREELASFREMHETSEACEEFLNDKTR